MISPYTTFDNSSARVAVKAVARVVVKAAARVAVKAARVRLALWMALATTA